MWQSMYAAESAKLARTHSKTLKRIAPGATQEPSSKRQKPESREEIDELFEELEVEGIPLQSLVCADLQGLGLMCRGRYEAARFKFEEQVNRVSEPLFHIACCEAKLGDNESALAHLNLAIRAGFHDMNRMESCADLDGLREQEEFKRLLSEAEVASQKRTLANGTLVDENIDSSEDLD